LLRNGICVRKLVTRHNNIGNNPKIIHPKPRQLIKMIQKIMGTSRKIILIVNLFHHYIKTVATMFG